MSTPTEDDLDNLPEAELLALPGGEAIPPGRLTAFFTRRAEIAHQHEIDELILELSGNSARHFIIFPGMDPKEKRRREEDERRRARSFSDNAPCSKHCRGGPEPRIAEDVSMECSGGKDSWSVRPSVQRAPR